MDLEDLVTWKNKQTFLWEKYQDVLLECNICQDWDKNNNPIERKFVCLLIPHREKVLDPKIQEECEISLKEYYQSFQDVGGKIPENVRVVLATWVC